LWGNWLFRSLQHLAGVGGFSHKEEKNMDSRAKLLGHSIHQMLVVFPLGLLVSSVFFDVVYRTTYNEIYNTVAFINLTAGIVTGAIAAVFGWIDFKGIPKYTRAKKIGTFHGFGNLALLLFFSISWLLRVTFGGDEAPVIAVLASGIGLIIGLVTAWMGGELVSRLGVGVHPGANLNAPSSLSNRPAHRPLVGVPITGDKDGNKIEDTTVTAPVEDDLPPEP
jgi:uncharacterized membrane protein